MGEFLVRSARISCLVALDFMFGGPEFMCMSSPCFLCVVRMVQSGTYSESFRIRCHFLFGDVWGSDRWQHAAAIFWGVVTDLLGYISPPFCSLKGVRSQETGRMFPIVFPLAQSMRRRFNAGSEQSKNSVSVTVFSSLILELVVPVSIFADTRPVEG